MHKGSGVERETWLQLRHGIGRKSLCPRRDHVFGFELRNHRQRNKSSWSSVLSFKNLIHGFGPKLRCWFCMSSSYTSKDHSQIFKWSNTYTTNASFHRTEPNHNQSTVNIGMSVVRLDRLKQRNDSRFFSTLFCCDLMEFERDKDCTELQWSNEYVFGNMKRKLKFSWT